MPTEIIFAEGSPSLTNLRADSDGALVPTGTPAIIAAGATRSYPLLDGEHLCVSPDGLSLSVVTDTEIYACGALPSPFTGHCRAGTGAWWIFTTGGVALLARHDSAEHYALHDDVPGPGCVRLGAAEMATATQTVMPPKLTGDYQRGYGALTAADGIALGHAMLDAWSAMSSRAAAGGVFTQPALMAWRLLDVDGQEIFGSAPQWVGPDAGLQLTGPITTSVHASGSNFCMADPFDLTARTWQPRIDIAAIGGADSFWADRCARLEIIAAPQLDFTCGAEASSGRLDLNSSNQCTLRAFMPGAAAGATTDLAAMQALTLAALRDFRRRAIVVATLAGPFRNPGSHTVMVNHCGPVAYSGELPPQLTLPNRFSATNTLMSGTVMFLAGIESAASPGEWPSSVATETEPQSCKEQVITRLAVRAVGWCQQQGELWIVTSDGVPRILTSSGLLYRRSPMRIREFCAGHDGTLHLLDYAGCLRDAAVELPPAEVNVECRRTVEFTLPRSAVAEWHLDAEKAALTLGLTAGSGGADIEVCTLSVNGSVNSPIRARIFAPRRRFVTLYVRGTLTAPARLRRLRI